MERLRVMCVDGEPHIVEGLSAHLEPEFEVHTATSGAQGLDTLEAEGPFAVVLSGVRMPDMDGATFLTKMRERAPTCVRVLLAERADLEAAIPAVNSGQIFHLLTKPCPAEDLRDAVAAAASHHRLMVAERVALSQALNGSIRALVQVLALTNPVAFERGVRVMGIALKLAAKLTVPILWHIESAAMLAQIGCITLPEQTSEKLFYGLHMSEMEAAMVKQLPVTTQKLLGHIPRLEPVIEILHGERVGWSKDNPKTGRPTPLGSRILRVASDFDTLAERGFTTEVAIRTLWVVNDTYDPTVLAALQEIFLPTEVEPEVAELPRVLRAAETAEADDGPKSEAEELVERAHELTFKAKRRGTEISLRQLTQGMVLAEDVLTTNGAVLAARGYEVTDGFIIRAQGIGEGTVVEPICVMELEIDLSASSGPASCAEDVEQTKYRQVG